MSVTRSANATHTRRHPWRMKQVTSTTWRRSWASASSTISKLTQGWAQCLHHAPASPRTPRARRGKLPSSPARLAPGCQLRSVKLQLCCHPQSSPTQPWPLQRSSTLFRLLGCAPRWWRAGARLRLHSPRLAAIAATHRVMLALLDLVPEHLLRERLQGREHAVLLAADPLPEGVIQRRVAHVLVRVSVAQRRQVVEQRVPDQDLVLQQRDHGRGHLLERRGWASAPSEFNGCSLRVDKRRECLPPSRSLARIPLSARQLQC